jgi:nucleotide-binding universal stress UspA family protein
MEPRKKILIAIDFSEDGRRAFQAGAGIARDLEADVLLVHAAPQPPEPDLTIEYATRKVAASGASRPASDGSAEMLEQWATELRRSGLSVETVSRPGTAIPLILQEAKRNNTTMIVVGTQGRNPLQRLLEGSVARQVIHRSPVPVLVAPPHLRSNPGRRKARPLRTVVVAMDFSKTSGPALKAAEDLAQGLHSGLRLVHVVQPLFVGTPLPETSYAYSPEIMAQQEAHAAAELSQWAGHARKKGIVAVPSVQVGDPAIAIVDEAKKAAAPVIVVGTHGLTGLRRLFMGSVAQKVVQLADRPVLVVPAAAAKRRPRRKAKNL